MGNTRIQDANTGHIMGLREGFIPIGMKEHGGVIYIASVNKEGEGEIGTIPSPIIRDFLKESTTMTINSTPITTADKGTGDNYVRISNRLYPGEKFLMALNLQTDDEKDACSMLLQQTCHYKGVNGDTKDVVIKYPLINGYVYTQDDKKSKADEIVLCSDLGVYNITLFSQSLSGIFKAPDKLISPQSYQEKGKTDITTSQHWFLNYANKPNFNLNPDLRLMNASGYLKSYPSTSLPGYLCVKAELAPKEIVNFGILKRQVDKLRVPFTEKILNGKSYSYYTYFPGFYYKSNTFSYINQIKVSVYSYTNAANLILHLGKSNTEESNAEELMLDVYKYSYIIKTDERKYCITNRSEDFNNTWVEIGVPDAVGVLYTTGNTSYKYQNNLFYVDLGSNNNQWCLLRVSFYNQYGDNIGQYTSTFNPYMNDTFGQNLSPVYTFAEQILVNTTVVLSNSNISDDPCTIHIIGHNAETDNSWGKNYDRYPLDTSDGRKKWWISASADIDSNVKGGTIDLNNFTIESLSLVSKYDDFNYNTWYTKSSSSTNITYNYDVKLNKVYVCPQALNSGGYLVLSNENVNEKYIIGADNVANSGKLKDPDTKWNPTWTKLDLPTSTALQFTTSCGMAVTFDTDSIANPDNKQFSSAKTLMICTNYKDELSKKRLAKIYGSNCNKVADSTTADSEIYVQFNHPIVKNKSIVKTVDTQNQEVKLNTDLNTLLNVDRSEKLPMSVTYAAQKLVYDQNHSNIPESISICNNGKYPRCAAPYIKAVFDVNVERKVGDTKLTASRTLIPYIIHKVSIDGKKEVTAGIGPSIKDGFQKTTPISWKKISASIDNTLKDSQRATSWEESYYKQETVELTDINLGIHVLNISGKIGKDFKIMYNNGISESEVETSIVNNNYFVPIVIVNNDTSNIKIYIDNYSYITDIQLGTISDLSFKCNLSNGVYNLNDYNSKVNNKSDEEVDPIILPIVSCYKESYYFKGKEHMYKINNAGLEDKDNLYAIYYPPANYMCYTFKDGSLDKDVDMWYYQAKVTRDFNGITNYIEKSRYENANISILNSSTLHVNPGKLEVKIEEDKNSKLLTVDCNFSLEELKFNQIWK